MPGNDHIIYPDGFAKPLPAGSKLVFQIHYTPNGTATQDQVKFGVLFSKSAPEHIVQTIGIAGLGLRIPPNTDNHPESATIPVPQEVRLLGFMPHMHVRGKAFRYEVLLPDGTARTLAGSAALRLQLAARLPLRRTAPHSRRQQSPRDRLV